MKASVASWTLLSPEGTYHELCEPNFFVGREDHMDLKLRVGLNFSWISVAGLDIEARWTTIIVSKIVSKFSRLRLYIFYACMCYYFGVCVNMDKVFIFVI